VTTANPIGKYDWYTIGGRWQGSVLRVKPMVITDISEGGGSSDTELEGGYFDICRKGDVDWEGMARDAADAARHSWHAVHAVIDAYPPMIPWSEFLAREPAGRRNHDEAAKQYHAQPAIIALGESDLSVGDPEGYLCSEDECAQRAAAAAGVTMAVVKDGQWYGRGLGWWNADQAGRDDWNRRFHELIEDVPDDVILWVVDCHI
jgi:hypothetical protein